MIKFILFLLPLSQLLSAEQFLYLTASGDQTVEVYKVNSGSGDLTLFQTVKLKGRPGNSVFSPGGQFYYVAVKGNSFSGVETFKIGNNGKISSAGFAVTPLSAGFLSVDSNGEILFASHYTEGKVSYYELDSGVYKGKVLGEISTDKKAHSIKIDRKNSYLYIPHTEPNRIFQFELKEKRIIPLNPPSAGGPETTRNFHEPRHFVFHPSKKLIYTSNERGGGISSWQIAENGQLTLWQTLSTLPENYNWNGAASDIQISANGSFAYVANRDNSSRKAPTGNDSIASFLIDDTGSIVKRTGIVPVGRHPRSLRIDMTGKFLYGAGVNSSNLTLYKIDQTDGSLTKIKVFKTGKNPMWVTCLEK